MVWRIIENTNGNNSVKDHILQYYNIMNTNMKTERNRACIHLLNKDILNSIFMGIWVYDISTVYMICISSVHDMYVYCTCIHIQKIKFKVKYIKSLVCHNRLLLLTNTKTIQMLT